VADPVTAGLLQIAGGALSGGVLVALVNGLLVRRKTNAETESVSIATANALMEGMRSDIDRYRIRITEADSRVSRLEVMIGAYGRRVDYLTNLLSHNGVAVNDWKPPDA
jgi:hypothetical protein